jgi:D-inositol-3-phosphate glycosyltransferase
VRRLPEWVRSGLLGRVRGATPVRRLTVRLRRLADRGKDGMRTPAKGPLGAVLRYGIDQPIRGAALPGTGTTRVVGWAATGDRPVLAVAVHLDGRLVGHTATGTEERPDLVEALGWESLRWAGWALDVDLGKHVEGGCTELVITVWPDGDEQPIVLDPVPVVLGPVPAGEPEAVGAAEFRVGIDQPDDGATIGPDAMRMAGWVLHDRYPISSLDVVVNGRHAGRARLGLARPELHGSDLPARAPVSGFEHVLDLDDLPESESVVRIQLVARASGGVPVVVASRVCRRRSGAGPGEVLPVAATRSPRATDPAQVAGEFDLLVFTHSLDYGGGQLWLSELLGRAGAGRAFSCTVVSPVDGPLRSEFERVGIRVRVTQPFPVDSLASYEGRVAELMAYVSSGGHTVALVNTLSLAIGADVTRRLGIPTVWAVHESFTASTFWSHALAGRTLPSGIRARFEEALRDTSCLVFEAEATRRLYVGRAGPGRAVVVPYGIDTAAVGKFVAGTDRAAMRDALGIVGDRRVALVMGTTEPRKAQTRLAEAFALVAGDHADWDLVFVGDTGTPYADALRRFVTDAGLDGRVRIVPVVPDTYPWYRIADILVSASDVESLPRSALEAMCFGVPVLATSVFGLPELLTDEVTGFLIEPGDLDALVAGLHRVLGMDPTRIRQVGDSACQLILDHYDSQGYATDIIGLLEEMRRDPAIAPAEILATRVRRGAPHP